MREDLPRPIDHTKQSTRYQTDDLHVIWETYSNNFARSHTITRNDLPRPIDHAEQSIRDRTDKLEFKLIGAESSLDLQSASNSQLEHREHNSREYRQINHFNVVH